MQISKRKVNNLLEKQVRLLWYQMIVDIHTLEEAGKVFGDILSETELAAVTKRLATGYWLSKNRSYQNIKDNLKVSSATIASVQQDLKKPGWQVALKKISADEWASKWEEKIKGVFSKIRK